MGADRLLGGPGADTLAGRRRARTRSPGAAGGTTLAASSARTGSRAARAEDRLRGDPPQGDDYYTPRIRLGADVLRGGPGDDGLSDTGGANRIEGGSGRRRARGRLRRRPPRRRVGSRLAERPPRGGSALGRRRAGRDAGRQRGRPALRRRGVDRLFGGSGPDRLQARDRSRTAPTAAAGAIAPRSTRKTTCTLAKACVAVAILRRVDQAFPHSSAAHSLTPRRTAIA